MSLAASPLNLMKKAPLKPGKEHKSQVHDLTNAPVEDRLFVWAIPSSG